MPFLSLSISHWQGFQTEELPNYSIFGPYFLYPSFLFLPTGYVCRTWLTTFSKVGCWMRCGAPLKPEGLSVLRTSGRQSNPASLCRPFKVDQFPILYDLAHVAAWDQYNLHGLAHASWGGSVPCKSCTSSQGLGDPGRDLSEDV